MRRAVFLDRDGTLMHDRGYLADPSGVELLPDAANAIVALRERGALLVLVSNQSGIARGLIGPEQHARVHERFVTLLAECGAPLDASYYCEHGPDDGCDCRKPRAGMLHAAARDHGIDLTASFMVGDKASDVAAGRAAGCTTALLATAGDADLVAPDWPSLLRGIRARLS